MTRHEEIINRLLATYPMGPGLVAALAAYVRTEAEKGRATAKDEVAAGVCEGLHNGPAKGLACKACVDAERGAPMLLNVESEIAIRQADADRKNR